MTEPRITGTGMRYLGGWGGDLETEVASTTLAGQAQALDMIMKRLRQRNLKERAYILKKWQQRYEAVARTLFDEQDMNAVMQDDPYMKKVRRNLDLA